MRPDRNERPLFACMAFFFFLFVIPSHASGGGQGNLATKRDLVWSWPESEVDSPRFSDDGNFIVLATRVHWPDAGEAEGLPDSFFAKLVRIPGQGGRDSEIDSVTIPKLIRSRFRDEVG